MGIEMQAQNEVSGEIEKSGSNQVMSLAFTKLSLPKFGLPILKDFARDTIGTFKRLSRHGDAVKVRVGWQQVHFLFHPELLRSVLLEDERSFFKDPRNLKVFEFTQGRSVLTTVGEAWIRQRKLLSVAFSPKRVAGYLDLMRDAAIDANSTFFPSDLRSGVTFDPSVYASQITMDVMLRVLFSEKMTLDEASALRRLVNHVSQTGQRMLQWPLIPARWMPFPGRREFLEHCDLLRRPIRQRIEKRHTTTSAEQTARLDLIDAMLLAEDHETAADQLVGQKRLTAQEVEDNCITLFSAGFETSAGALMWWMGYMAQCPHHAQRARSELVEVMGADWKHRELEPSRFASLNFLEATLKEAMRLRPPAVSVFNRVANRDVSLQGIKIRRGDMVSGSIWTLHHDERWFPEPEKFNPDRFMPGAPAIPRGAFLPFGAGPHVCIGQHFAMLEMKLVAALLLTELEWRFLPGGTLPDPRVDVTIKPERRFQLIADRIANQSLSDL
jgi:cytochrome P450